MSGKYRIVFLGLTVERAVFAEKMAQLGVDGVQGDEIINRAPVILKEGLDMERARRYADAVQNAGGRAVIKDDGVQDEQRMVTRPLAIIPFADFIMCPVCGHKQPKGEFCEKCRSKISD